MTSLNPLREVSGAAESTDMGNRVAHIFVDEITHVANACTDIIQVFWESRKLHIDETAFEVTSPSGDKVSEVLEGSQRLSLLLKPDTRIQYQKCSPKEYIQIRKQGDVYLTVIRKRASKDELMCLNIYIPCNRSVIAVDDGMVKFSEYGTIWTSDDGVVYK